VVNIKKKLLILLTLSVMISLIFVSFVVAEEVNQSQIEEIGEGMYYNIRSSIFTWFSGIIESTKSIFVENVKIYEEASKKYGDYYKQRNDNIVASKTSTSEPSFNRELCSVTMPGGDIRHTFCSCGDGVCASYEDKGNCPIDCGSCPEGTVHERGQCVEYVPNICMNAICEEGENETCPWDCNTYMIEEREEVIGQDESNFIKERSKLRAKEFVESHGELFVEGNESETMKETLPEEVN
jgi:hypothetical protein